MSDVNGEVEWPPKTGEPFQIPIVPGRRFSGLPADERAKQREEIAKRIARRDAMERLWREASGDDAHPWTMYNEEGRAEYAKYEAALKRADLNYQRSEARLLAADQHDPLSMARISEDDRRCGRSPLFAAYAKISARRSLRHDNALKQMERSRVLRVRRFFKRMEGRGRLEDAKLAIYGSLVGVS